MTHIMHELGEARDYLHFGLVKYTVSRVRQKYKYKYKYKSKKNMKMGTSGPGFPFVNSNPLPSSAPSTKETKT